MMKCSFTFNPGVHYMKSLLTDEFVGNFLLHFPHFEIEFKEDFLIVFKYNHTQFHIGDHGNISLDTVGDSFIGMIDDCLSLYIKLHEMDDRFRFPYTFSLRVDKKDSDTCQRELDDKNILYDKLDHTKLEKLGINSDHQTFEIKQRAYLY